MHVPIVMLRDTIEPAPDLNTVAVQMAVSPAAPPLKRMKIWEMDASLHCPVIGLCLPNSELGSFARRFCFGSPLDDLHALHVEAVCGVASKNNFSEAVHKLLDRLHHGYVEQFNQAKTDSDVMLLWQRFFTDRKIAGPLWAALTHKRISEKSRKRIHEVMHMFMHEAALDLAATQGRIAESAHLLAEMTVRLEQLKQQHAHTEARLKHLLQQAQSEIRILQQSHQETETLRKRLTQLESGQAMTQMGQRLTQLKAEIGQLQIRCATFDELKASLKASCHNLAELYRERDAWYLERDVLEALVLKNGHQPHASSTTENAAIATDNAAFSTNVLCVGGKSSLLPHYRALAEQFGLALLHHDGGQENALSRLPDMIHRAQSVMCPTDCVSHAAYYQVKRLCSNNRKPCLLFKGMGVSSFAAALAKISSGEISMI